MKIGIIGTRGIPNRYGGFEQFAEKLSQGLARKGHAVFVYNSSLHPYRENKLGDVNIIHCYDAEDWLGTAGQFIYDRNCLVDAKKRGFDILLHLGYTSDSIFHRKWRRPALHIVNMDGLEWKRSKYNGITKRFLRLAESWAIKHADLLIADSTGIQEYLKNCYGSDSIFIPYGATPYKTPVKVSLEPFDISPGAYGIIVARMEPENNIEMIIRAWINSGRKDPLIIVGGRDNSFARKMQKKYPQPEIRFLGPIYNNDLLDDLRYHSACYFHGHSVGGTNPSLLEAMACMCNILAHDNIFNRSVLEENAFFFSSEKELTELLINEASAEILEQRRGSNLRKIEEQYNWDRIIDSYEEAMANARHAFLPQTLGTRK